MAFERDWPLGMVATTNVINSATEATMVKLGNTTGAVVAIALPSANRVRPVNTPRLDIRLDEELDCVACVHLAPVSAVWLMTKR